jgi:drug/metabolite transporter (DMT)-like permease
MDSQHGTALPVILPLLGALVYVAAALCIKRAAELGVPTWRATWVCNAVAALFFAPLMLFGGTIPPWHQFWQPALVALLFVAGQVLSIHSLQKGDVSVATPVLGLKIVMVAISTTLLIGNRLSISLWAAAALSSIAVALLNATESGKHHHVGATVVTAGGAAAAYAVFDVLVQKWSPAWGLGRFLPVMMGFVAAYSVLFRVTKRAPAMGRVGVGGWLAAGAICLAVQSLLIVFTIARFGNATVANVLYSSRGLWSVLAVWLVGHWFANREQHLKPSVLTARLLGSGFLLTAIILVVLR